MGPEKHINNYFDPIPVIVPPNCLCLLVFVVPRFKEEWH